jgi:hypothetical protein
MKKPLIALAIGRNESPVTMKEQLATLFEQLAGKQSMQRILHGLGLDPRQFVLFLGLFRSLSEREELMGIVGVNRFNISYLALFIAAILVLPWTLAVDSTPAPFYLLADLALTFALTFLIIIREAANTLFNPVEASILAHNPIHGPTYAASKIAHILITVSYLVLGLNLYPALIGFVNKGAHWYWLVTHLASAFLIGFWTAFVICALYGFMIRLVPASLLKGISTWIQLLAFVAFVAIPMFFASSLFGIVTARSGGSKWALLPLTSFVDLGLLGCRGASWRLGWEGVLSVLASIIVVWFGLRGFSSTYFAETASMVQGGSWRNREKSALSRFYVLTVRAVTGSPIGLGVFCFVSKLLRRDWQFRRAVLMQTWLPLLIMLAIVMSVARGASHPSPFSSSEPSFAHLLPHFLGLITMALCINICFTDFHKASWIYLVSPLCNLRSFAKGVFWALWIPSAGITHIILLSFMTRFWGWKEASIAAGFSLVVVSLYLGFELNLISGLPFSSPLNESSATQNVIFIQTCCLATLIAPTTAHWALFQVWWIALVAGIVLLIAAWQVIHWTLGELEGLIRWKLHLLKTGDNKIFEEIG